MGKYNNAITKYGNNFSPSEFLIRDGAVLSDFDYQFFCSYLKFRAWDSVPHLVSTAYRPDDSGAHGRGLAVDIIRFADWLSEPADWLVGWRKVKTWPFWGVGIYFDWTFRNNSGKEQPAIGYHLDGWTEGDRPLRWLRVKTSIDGEEKSRYFYHNPADGKFWHWETNTAITLQQARQIYCDRMNRS